MNLLKETLSERKLILASRSPRRRQLLTDCGLDFSIADDYDVNESWPEGLQIEQVAPYLAELKSTQYPFELGVDDILVTADTVVICGDRILGKPHDRNEAIDMLRMLSGNPHEVITGVCLRDVGHKTVFAASTKVWFRELSYGEIEYYVDNYRPYDKAGAYAIQEWIGCVAIERIEGSFYNVMGLPVQMLYVKLNDFVKH